MRYPFLICLSLLFLSLDFTPAQADSLYVQGQIVEATLYRNTALLTARVQVTIPAGEHEVVVTQLPESFEPQSLQVRGTGDFTILAARARQASITAERLPVRIQRLKDSLDDLREDLAVYRNQHYTYRMEEQMLLMNRQVAGSQSGLKIDELQAATDYFRQRMLEVRAKLLSLNLKIEKAVRDSADLGESFNTGAGRIGAPYTQVSIYVRGKTRTQATLYLTFLTYVAGWNPVYELRAAEASSKVNLVLKALAFQNTGYDWSKVKLTVSSGQPGLGAQKPYLPPITAGLDRPVVYNMAKTTMRYKTKAASGVAAEADMAQAAPMQPPAAQYEQVDIDDQSLSISYTLAEPATMFSDNREQTFELTRQDIDARLRLATAPAMDKDVFVEAIIRDWGSLGLLPGPVRVFFDDAFTGESNLPSSAAQDSLVVSLGRDRKVLAKREAIPVRESKSLLSGKRTKEYHYDITIRNNRKTAATIRVEDRVPISRSADVEVERLETSGAIINEDNGLLYWDVVVPAGESKKVTLRYSIKSPKGQEVILR